MNVTAEEIRRRLGAEPRLHGHRVVASLVDRVATLEGEAPDLAAKKIALEIAAAVPGVEHIVDRIRVEPATRMGDDEIRDHVRDLLLEEPALQPLLRAPPAPVEAGGLAPGAVLGAVGLTVHDGVVTLDGYAPSLAHKRLAGVLAWWVPGVRDVVNGVEVVPPEQDDDGEITDAVRIALEKDPLVDAGEVGVSTRGAVVTLAGVVPCETQRRAAERDAWCVFGVDGVRNEIQVRA
ncbi:MAG TPA: BON domain-containing protein [Anaeromyxobacteraceae bacterium]|nr:BON domain-containing protein [Anaeromyxobacteraceae bacterium]